MSKRMSFIGCKLEFVISQEFSEGNANSYPDHTALHVKDHSRRVEGYHIKRRE
jgi:hypothetical protein